MGFLMYICIPKGMSREIFESQICDKFENKQKKYISFSTPQFHLKLKKINHVEKRSWVYVRSVTDFLLIYLYGKLFKKNLHICFDFRGIISEESFMRKRSIIRKKILYCLEWFSYICAHEVWTVSEKLKDYLIRNYGKKDIHVEACKINKKFVVRKIKKTKDNLVFIYVGSLSKWQSFDRACRIYKSVENDKTEFIVITKDTEKAKTIMFECGIKNFMVQSCCRNEVFDYLDMADFGFILRDNNVVNTTASPVKFVEYISRGVIPIATKYVGDYSNFIDEIGYVLDDDQNSVLVDELSPMISNENFDLIYSSATSLTW